MPEQGNGIGLLKARRRPDLLYTNSYSLSVDENTAKNEYEAHLTLDLL